MRPPPAVGSAARIADAVLAAPPRCGGVRLVCVDGPAGSGKTTAAGALADALTARGSPGPVVHLDDLYEGWTQPLGAPLAARVEAWLLLPWRDGLPGRHPRYDWAVQRFTAWAEAPAGPVAVIEGCGAASRGIRAYASLVVWVEAERSVRLARGLARDGDALAEEWDRWQAAETAHFAADGTRAAADVIIRT